MLFASLFWFCLGCGVLALAGAAATHRGRLGGLRVAMAAIVLAGGLVLSLVIESWFGRTAGSAASFAAAHTASFVVALLAWIASGVGLMAEGWSVRKGTAW